MANPLPPLLETLVHHARLHLKLTSQRPTSGADGPASVKKAKPDSTSKPAQIASKPKSKTTGNGKAASSKAKAKEAIPEEAAEKEKEAEAPADAEPETDGKALKEGDKLPSITLKDEEGQDVEIGKLAGDKGVVLFLYPKVSSCIHSVEFGLHEAEL